MQGQWLPTYYETQFTNVWIFSVYIQFLPYFSNLVNGQKLLARAAVPVFSAAFPLGGASIIIAQNTDAFGVFECPHLYWDRKMFIFVPVKLIMISKHDFIKAAMGLCP